MKKLYEEASVQDIADAIREKTGGAETYRIAQMGAAVRSIPGGDQIAHADIPDYVKDGVLALAQKVQAVKTASSIVFVTVADAHHATDESTGWKANIEAGNMDACRENLMACGDGLNDRSMIEYAGVGVAMQNAEEPVKAVADYVTAADNNHDGVAEAVEKFILRED